MPSKAPHPRPTQEQRSDATRERLILATIDCIAEKGYAGASSAEISERAGVSSGARVHHFKAKLDLVIATALYTYEKATVESVSAAASPVAQSDPLPAFINDSYQFYSGERYLVQHELINAGRTSADLLQAIRPAADAFRQAVNTAWLRAFEQAGHSREWSERAMELSVVMVRGLALGSFLRGRERDAAVLRMWREVMALYPDERRNGQH
ncbi:TetR/AcrR family transcriptional regulator [Ottowia thiooxydans]|uniref:TetR/AcrR family transcriptional regulator n=1 Tax=Ottowia thiooxydans TaxID=219182 RepID=UPI00146DB46E|nr:TetR/AcrR family transcriptional regulator [Ottowia thiooxydans]